MPGLPAAALCYTPPMASIPMDHAGRLRRLQGALPESKLEFLLVTHLPNVRYLSGFTGSAAALLVSGRGARLFTDGRYIVQAKEEVRGADVMIVSKSPAVAAAEWLSSRRRMASRQLLLGIEPESLTAGMHDRLTGMLRGKARVRSAPPLVERARMVKDLNEIGRIRAAVDLGASLFRVARQKIRPGVSEVEVAAAIEFEARRRFVVCDFGIILAGYCSDRTRTVHVGQPSKEARQLYAAVLEAQRAAIAAVRPGVSAAEVDEAARSVLRKRKLAAYFTHSTGHGLGLEIHEAPRLAAGQAQKLESGMVVTIEPGAYVPGKCGVRIEDVVVVTPSGCEVLVPTDKDLIVI
jgi:Xaa-Pro aminopeptidase